MKEAGIIDPTKVARQHYKMQHQLQVQYYLTECTVVNEPSDDNKQPQMDPMMGMM